jgi:hypothetical protein
MVVCTDGLTGVVSDEELAEVLGGIADMDEVCRILVEMARAAGGPDNITVVAASFDDPTLRAPAASDRVVYERWRLDEEEETTGVFSPPSNTGTTRAQAPMARAGRPGHAGHHSFDAWPEGPKVATDPARVFFAMALLVAATLTALIVGTQLRRSGVRCEVAGPPGMSLRIDGHDVGQRTRVDAVTIRLPPGHHRVALVGKGAPSEELPLDVVQSGACRLRFEDGR